MQGKVLEFKLWEKAIKVPTTCFLRRSRHVINKRRHWVVQIKEKMAEDFWFYVLDDDLF